MRERSDADIWEKVLENRGLIHAVIKKELKFSRNISFDDLYQEGLLALYKACLYEDKSKDKGNSTYMSDWIKYSLWAYIKAFQSPVYVPRHHNEPVHGNLIENDIADNQMAPDVCQQEEYLLDHIAETILDKNSHRIKQRRKGKGWRLNKSETFAILNLFPNRTTREIANIFGVSISTIARVRQRANSSQ